MTLIFPVFLGTLAGNDTVFVACADERGAQSLAGWLKRDISGLVRRRSQEQLLFDS